MARTLICLCMLTFVLAACSPAQFRPTPSSKVFSVGDYTESMAKQAYSNLRTKAAFELKCGEDALTFVQLAPNQLAPVGVQGCGNQATYLSLRGQWVMDSSSSAQE